MSDLPDDLSSPRRDHSFIANIVVGGVLMAITIAMMIFILVVA